LVIKEQVQSKRMLNDFNPRIGLHSSDECALNLGTSGITAGMSNAIPMVPTFSGQSYVALSISIKMRAKGNQIFQGTRAFSDSDMNSFKITQTNAGNQGVRFVFSCGVLGTYCDSDPALRPLRCTRG
jgi:hypothetical protein